MRAQRQYKSMAAKHFDETVQIVDLTELSASLLAAKTGKSKFEIQKRLAAAICDSGTHDVRHPIEVIANRAASGMRNRPYGMPNQI